MLDDTPMINVLPAQNEAVRTKGEHIFHRFTKQSYDELLAKEAERKEKEKDRKNEPVEEKLIDGKLAFESVEEDDAVKPRADLAEGCKLPKSLGNFPPELIGVPIEEVDSGVTNKVSLRKTHNCGLII